MIYKRLKKKKAEPIKKYNIIYIFQIAVLLDASLTINGLQ